MGASGGVQSFHEARFNAAQQGTKVRVAELLESSFSYRLHLCSIPWRGKPNLVIAQTGYQGADAPPLE